MKTAMLMWRLAACIPLALTLLSSLAYAARFLPLGTGGGGPSSTVTGISADGTIVVGETDFPNKDGSTFRWAESTGLLQLEGTLPGSTIEALGIPSDRFQDLS